MSGDEVMGAPLRLKSLSSVYLSLKQLFWYLASVLHWSAQARADRTTALAIILLFLCCFF